MGKEGGRKEGREERRERLHRVERARGGGGNSVVVRSGERGLQTGKRRPQFKQRRREMTERQKGGGGIGRWRISL